MLENYKSEKFATQGDIFQCDRLRVANIQMLGILEELEKNLKIMEEVILLHKKVNRKPSDSENIGPWEQI